MTAFAGIAQTPKTGIIKGILVDTITNETIARASVSVRSRGDSSLVAFVVSNDKGEFEIKNLPYGLYMLSITYQGYQPISKHFDLISKAPLLDFGLINMERNSTMLAEVVIELAPVSTKKDTVEFLASAFKTKPNGTTEDLLKKLPGVQVDREGNIKAQGEIVQKVYVDGKEFFGNDPKIATRNLAADMIESVQLYNDKSDRAKFTQMDDGEHIKTINIKLKKDRQHGYFGRLATGYGTDSRTQSNLNYNSFSGEHRVSFVGGYNNVNNLAFGDGAASSTSSKAGSKMGMPGISSSRSAGVNYSNKFGSKLNVTGSYFNTGTAYQNEKAGLTQVFFPGDSTVFRHNEGKNKNRNESHRAHLRLEYLIDSNNTVLFTTNINALRLSGANTDTSFTRSVKTEVENLENSATAKSSIINQSVNANSNLLYRRKFGKRGRTLTLFFNNNINQTEDNSLNQTYLKFYRPGGQLRNEQVQDIKSSTVFQNHTNAISGSFTEPLGKKEILEFSYAYNHNFSTSDRKVHGYNPATKNYDSLNTQLSNSFDNDFQANRYGIHFKLQTAKHGLQVGGALQTAHLLNKTRRALFAATGKDTLVTLTQRTLNFFPSMSYTYNIDRSKSLQLNYNGRTRQPSALQLQQAPDVTTPLLIRTGNPSLRQEFTNDFTLGYNSFNAANLWYFAVNVYLSQTTNGISNSVDTVPRGLLGSSVPDKTAQLVRPLNVNGIMSSTATITLGMPFNKIQGSNFDFTSTVSYNRDVNVVYKMKNTVDYFSASQTVGVNLNFTDKLNLSLKGDLAYNTIAYSIQKSFNTAYLAQTYTADVSCYLSKRLLASSDFAYTSNKGIAGFDFAASLWNAGIACQLFKRSNGELRLSVNDILNQNKSFFSTMNENYITSTKTTVLRRYFLLSFTYNFRAMGHRSPSAGKK